VGVHVCTKITDSNNQYAKITDIRKHAPSQSPRRMQHFKKQCVERLLEDYGDIFDVHYNQEPNTIVVDQPPYMYAEEEKEEGYGTYDDPQHDTETGFGGAVFKERQKKLPQDFSFYECYAQGISNGLCAGDEPFKLKLYLAGREFYDYANLCLGLSHSISHSAHSAHSASTSETLEVTAPVGVDPFLYLRVLVCFVYAHLRKRNPKKNPKKNSKNTQEEKSSEEIPTLADLEGKSDYTNYIESLKSQASDFAERIHKHYKK